MTQRVQIKIKGMHCKSCADLIESKLKELEGIKEVEVSFAKEQAVVQFDEEKTNFEDIKNNIEKAGYTVVLEDSAGLDFAEERLIRIRLGKPNILAVLVAIVLIFSLINIFYTANLQSKVASLLPENSGTNVQEGDIQSKGALKEVEPNIPSQQPAPIKTGEPEDFKNEDLIISAGDNPVSGLETAPVTMIEFSDYECPFCGRFFGQTLGQIEQNYIKTGKVRYVFLDFPLSFHPQAQKAAEASECAAEQGKFWEYHDKLFENQAVLGIDDLKQYARELGLDTVKFSDCLDSGKMAQGVQEDFSAGLEYGVTGTPTFFINGIKLVGAQPYSEFERVIEQELNKQ